MTKRFIKIVSVFVLICATIAINWTSISTAFNQIVESANIITTMTTIQTEPVSFVRVVDGDTIIVKTADNTEISVRLIGIDAPESVNPDESKNTTYGLMASDYLKTIFIPEGATLYLEYDEEKTDIYDRTLAYVWLTDEPTNDKDCVQHYMLNAELLEKGYAVNKTYQPNDKYSTVFNDLCNDAKNSKTGLWQYNDFINNN